MLSDRRQRVLQALIEEYVANAQPVGSRTLVDRYRLGVSPATVRNELSVLEEEGYLTSPHTSAGRVPTDAGYRAFVDDLLQREMGADAQEDAFSEVREAATRVDDLMEQTSAALTRLTDCLSVVLAPSLLGTKVKQVSLVSLSAYRAIMVVVTDDGQVLNNNIEFREEVAPDELAQVQNALNKVLSGHSFAEIRDAGTKRLSDVLGSPLAHLVVEEPACMPGKGRRRPRAPIWAFRRFCASRNSSMPKRRCPCFPFWKTIRCSCICSTMFPRLSARLRCVSARKTTRTSLSGVSVVAAQYGAKGARGVVAVIGPTRMDYSKVINVVRAARSALGDL